MASNGYKYEIIMVDDGSTDSSWKIVRELSEKNPHIRGISFRRNYGKSAALYEGFKAAEGRVVITMDADLQDSPDEIPELYRMVTEGGYDIVSGWKKQRFDNKLTKNLPSKLYNATARKVTGINLHDMNCGLKAYRNEVVKNIEVYGEMHRYIPYLAKNAGFGNITEKPVQRPEEEIWSQQIRSGEICEWLSRPDLLMVSQQIRKEAYAFLRLHRNTDVPCRWLYDHLDHRRETDTARQGRGLQACSRAAYVLSCTPCRHSGSPAVSRRIYMRNGFPQQSERNKYNIREDF